MKVRDVMSSDVQVARPGDTLQEVATRMASGDFGFMPVADGDRLIGTITDRDIAVRAVAGGAACTSPVVEYLSRDPQTARADDDLKTVLDSLGDLSTRVKEKYAGEALEDISRP